MSDPSRPDERPLLIEPVVAWPHSAETDCDYLVTVDLRGPLAEDDSDAEWPYPDEEFAFTVALDGSPHFVCTALDEPSVVLHRFGGTYGPANFRVTTGPVPGPAALWLTVTNQWGVPVRKAELRSEIKERDSERNSRARLAQVLPARASGPVPSQHQAPPRGGERRPAVTVPFENGRQSVTVSYAGFNRDWAVWIADRLERRGHEVALRLWDPPDGMSTADALRDCLPTSGRVLLVLHDHYFRTGTRGHDEWDTAVREVVVPNAGRFAAVSVTSSSLPSAAAVLEPVALYGLGAREAERCLLIRLGFPASPSPDDEGHEGPRFPEDAPEVWGGVPLRNPGFTGRDALLDKLGRRLRAADSGAVALCGMSGVGKTQLATEYIYRFGPEYDVVWWATADQLGTLRERLAQLAPALGLETGREYGERIRAVHQALLRGVPHRRWLLVLDSADEADGIADLVPTGSGHVLITTRNTDWALHGAELLEVPLYGRNESVDLIRRRAPRLTRSEAHRLAEALEDLPLLIDQTASWLNDSNLPVQEYIDLLERGADGNALALSADFPASFRTAWAILLNRLRETVPESVGLLRLCAFFSPGSIPVRLLQSVPVEVRPEGLAGLIDDPDLWDRTLRKLSQYSVARLESQATVLCLHRMVHRIARQDMSPEDAEGYAAAARASLAAAVPGRPTDPDTWPDYAEIVPHLEYADALGDTDPASQDMVLECLRYLYISGEYAAGLHLAEQAFTAWQSRLGDTHPRIWELTHHYANLLRAVGDYRRTEALERKAADHLRRERGEQDLDHLRAVSGLAADLRGLARYDEALELSRRLVLTYRDLLGEQDARTLGALNNLAVSLRLLGRYEPALDIDRQTLESRRRLLGSGHTWTLSSELHYAVDLRLLGRYTEAESVQARNVREYRLVMGADAPQTLEAEHNLALCLYRTGDRAMAGTLLTRVLERCERALGETDPQTLRFAASASCFTREHGDIDQAREIGEAVVSRYEVMLAEGHPYIAGVRANHALVLRNVGERDQAHVVVEQALADMKAAVGGAHPWTLGCAVNASALRNLVGDPERAAALSQETVTRAMESLGRTHPLTLSARIALAADQRALRDGLQAMKTEQAALDDLAATLGPRHVHTVSARSRNRPFWDFEPQET
ncbi:FxSxx-COOH system tetratricopeptide repeat protein [Streptomyces sp. NPDC002599]|uniref:FxSxx-COOH system tetratricopeptide repeat protein n=1 Tax=Streptomyces sp. NPDC002599 TaxID=3154421 RepID=UPI0033281D25